MKKTVNIEKVHNGFIMHLDGQIMVFSREQSITEEFFESFDRRINEMQIGEKVIVSISVEKTGKSAAS